MTSYAIKLSLRKKLNKLSKKDKDTYEQVLNKIDEVTSSEDIDHYKNLRKPLQHLKRVHIKSSVLTFKYDRSEDKVTFYKFGHHDDIYK